MPSFSTIIELIDYYTKFGLVKNTAGRQVNILLINCVNTYDSCIICIKYDV